jgi:TatD DNase family protein
VTVDAHTHLDFPVFDADRDAVLARARDAGVTGFVLAGADPERWDAVEALGRQLGMPWTLGVHPWWPDADGSAFQALCARETPHGIGETGLDYVLAKSDDARRAQQDSTRAHLALARERGVPVVLHCVRAAYDLVGLLRDDGSAGGMVHAWMGPADAARRLSELGVYVSLGSRVATSKHARRTAAELDENWLLLETDCPDQPLRPGTRGEPADVIGIARIVAELRGCSVDHVLQTTAANARRLFPALGGD